MAELKTTYQDDVLDTSKNTKRKYNMITNSDGTVSFEDVTEYSQVGDTFGASQVNEIDTNINALNNITCDPWDSSRTYIKDEYCVYNGKLYRCISDNTGQTPADSAYWFDTTAGFELLTLNQSLADSGWITLNKTYNTVYRKKSGIVFVRMNTGAIAKGVLIGTLPEGYRPSGQTFISNYGNDSYMYIKTDGTVTWGEATNAGRLCVSFPV